MRRLVVMALLVGCATDKPRGCVRSKVGAPAREVTTQWSGLREAGEKSDEASTLTTLDGRPVMFSSYTAPVSVIAFWATWCHPCLEELPYVEKLHQQYKDDRDVSIVAVSIDNSGALERVQDQAIALGLTIPVLHDPRKQLFSQFSERVHIPLLVFMDRDSKPYREFGLRSGSAEDFVARHRELIEQARSHSLPNEPPHSLPFGSIGPGNSVRTTNQ